MTQQKMVQISKFLLDYFTLNGHGKVMVIVVHFNSLQNKQRNNENFIGLFVFKICVDQ